MGYTVPIEHLLLLLCSDATILIKEVKESAFGLLQGCVGTSFKVSQVRENTLLELFGIFDRSAESLKSESKTSDNVSAGHVEEVVPCRVLESGCEKDARHWQISVLLHVPKHTRHIFAGGEKEASYVLILRPVDWS